MTRNIIAQRYYYKNQLIRRSHYDLHYAVVYLDENDVVTKVIACSEGYIKALENYATEQRWVESERYKYLMKNKYESGKLTIVKLTKGE